MFFVYLFNLWSSEPFDFSRFEKCIIGIFVVIKWFPFNVNTILFKFKLDLFVIGSLKILI
jgi:hypothetical protein